MASINANGSRGHHKFTLNVNETSVSGATDNKSTISWSCGLSPVQTGWDWYYSATVPVTYSITINGNTYTGNIMSYNGSSTVTIRSGTLEVPHNSDGTKTISFSFLVQDQVSANYLPGNASASGTLTLTPIARYLNITSWQVKSTDLNTITCRWVSDVARDYTWYSLNGGSWVAAGDTVASDNKSGEFTISGLTPNTSYSIKVKLRRKDNQLTTESSAVSGTTKDIAKISTANNFNHGDNLSVTITNPSGKNAKLTVAVSSTTIKTKDLSTGANTVTFTDSELDNIYKKYGTNNSVSVSLTLTTNNNSSYTNSKTVTCTLKGNQKTMRNKVSGSWCRGKLWIKVSGTWRRAVVWTKINGTWRRGI